MLKSPDKRSENVKTLAELQAECAALGIKVETNGRASKEPYITALRDHHWQKDHPDELLPPQIQPMLLASWEDLDEDEARQIEEDCHAWIVQEKLDGIRALVHVEGDRVRITSRVVSDTTYRLSELEANLVHLTTGLSKLSGTVLDGELLCPVAVLDTGSTTTPSSLQATMAILATSADNAHRVQTSQNAYVEFHAFDVLRHSDQDVTQRPLIERQNVLVMALRQSENSFIVPVPTYVVNKPAIHRRIIETGREGSVFKKADSPYLPGRRVPFWLKRKRVFQVEAFITAAKEGSNGHTGSIGALQFSVKREDGSAVPIAWVSNLSDRERQLLADPSSNGQPRLASHHLGRRAVLEGLDLSARSNRIRHARLVRWIDPIEA